MIALKLNAIKGRGVKKDFWDLARLLQDYSMNDLFQFYHDRYIYDDSPALIRSVNYFIDAEDNIDPICLNGMTWSKVKKVIIKSLDDYHKKKYKN